MHRVPVRITHVKVSQVCQVALYTSIAGGPRWRTKSHPAQPEQAPTGSDDGGDARGHMVCASSPGPAGRCKGAGGPHIAQCRQAESVPRQQCSPSTWAGPQQVGTSLRLHGPLLYVLLRRTTPPSPASRTTHTAPHVLFVCGCTSAIRIIVRGPHVLHVLHARLPALQVPLISHYSVISSRRITVPCP